MNLQAVWKEMVTQDRNAKVEVAQASRLPSVVIYVFCDHNWQQ